MSFEAEEYFRQGEARSYLPSGEHARMKYSTYKQRYPDCRTVPGTYDEKTRTVEVIIPAGRAKPSGTRGEQYGGFSFWYAQGGEFIRVSMTAISCETANRRAARIAKKHGLTPCEQPENVKTAQYRNYNAVGDNLILW